MREETHSLGTRLSTCLPVPMVTVVLISTGASILPVYRLGGHSGKKNRTSFQYCCGTFRLILSYVCYPWMTTFFLPFPFLLLFLPQKSAEDVSQFDSRFTAQTPIDSPVDFRISESANLNFQVCQTLLSVNWEPQYIQPRAHKNGRLE